MQAVSQTDCAENINMRIPKGCVYGLLGANGAGKSTLMKILCGMTRADAGSIFDGKYGVEVHRTDWGFDRAAPVYENLSAVDNLKCGHGRLGFQMPGSWRYLILWI